MWAPPKLYAISDLHVAHPENRRAVSAIAPHPNDWLIVAGDVAERFRDVRWGLETLRRRFRRMLWVPGNHDLWTLPDGEPEWRGEERYLRLVELCRSLDILTPEDPYPVWEGDRRFVIAPLFLLYDYTFRPQGQTKAEAMAIAWDRGVVCVDEFLLHPDPYASREEWCWARVDLTERRLAEVPATHSTVLVAHFPLRRDLVHVASIPEFAMWCGTTRTEQWHCRYRAEAVVTGHVHVPRTSWRDGVRFEEVSFGYPRERALYGREGLQLREILPGPQSEAGGDSDMIAARG
jgi:3',5'-cyclic AMP phosphodiesterase CpdA